MKSEWKKYLLGDLYSFSSGLSKNSKEFGFGKPFLSFKTVFNNYILPEELPDLVNSNIAEQKRCSILKGDIFLTRTSETLDELGMSCVALRDYPEATFNGFTKRLRPKGKQVYPLYAAYYMRSPCFRANINSMASMTTRASLNNDILSRLPIEVPTYEEQQKIGDILYLFDKKIKLNHRINENLQQQAQAIYHERFGNLYPDDLPSNWRICTLGEVATISKKSFNPLKEPETLLEHYSIPAFDETKFPVFELSTSIKSSKYVVDDNCFMISKLNPTTKRTWKPYCLTPNGVCSTEFIVYRAKDKKMTDYLYSVIDSAAFSDYMCSHVTGSTGSRQRTTPSDTLSFELYLPSNEALDEFQSLVTPMYVQMKINAIENDRLKWLRDSLLPKLMSGEIDVSAI